MRVYWNTYVSANSRLESVSSGLRILQLHFPCSQSDLRLLVQAVAGRSRGSKLPGAARLAAMHGRRLIACRVVSGETLLRSVYKRPALLSR
jgi:hypothetical protein